MNPKPPSFDALIQNQDICLATEGRSQKTIDWYANNLIRFLQFLRNRQVPDSVRDIGYRRCVVPYFTCTMKLLGGKAAHTPKI